MNEKQSYIVIDKVSNYYNLNFDDNKIDAWSDMLMRFGDYEETIKKLENRIMNGDKYPPSLSEVIAKPYQQNISTNREVHRMSKEQRKKLKQHIEEADEKAKNGDLTIHDL